MFSKESRRENKMAIPSRDDKSDEEETTEGLVMEEDYNEVLEETTQIATQSHHIAHIKSKSVKSKPDKFEPIFRF